MNVVWYRLRVSESQRHTPIKIFPSTPPGATSRDYRPVIFEGLFCIQILTFSRPLIMGKHMKEKKEKKEKHKHKSRHEL